MKRLIKEMVIAAVTIAACGAIAAVTILLCALYIPFGYYWALGLALVLIFVVLTVVTTIYFYRRIEQTRDPGELGLEKLYGPRVKAEMDCAGIGFMIVDSESVVTWQSDYLTSVGFQAMDMKLSDVCEDLVKLSERMDASIPTGEIQAYDRIFEVEFIREGSLFIFRDITDLKSAQSRYCDSGLFVAFVMIDNYADISTTVDEIDLTRWVARVSDILFREAEGHFAIRAMRDDSFIMIGTMDQPLKMEGDELAIVAEVKSIEGERISTISVGVAENYPDFSSACTAAYHNMELASARGGDQAMVSRFAQGSEYIGGKTESKASINRARIRLQSKDLFNVISQADTVLTFGHTNADFDSIGAALGVCAICRTLGVNCRIIYAAENTDEDCKKAFETIYGSRMKDLVVDYGEALDMLGDRTLVIPVDVSNPERFAYPNFIGYDSDVRVALIDHHRQGDWSFKRLVFDGSDSSASSACELLSSYIENAPIQVDLTSNDATMMVAGTMVDTQGFRSKVSAPTYRAMSYLMKRGASVDTAASITRESYSQFKTKVRFLTASTTLNSNICIAADPDPDQIVDTTMLALVANQAMNISGYDAAFAIGRISPEKVGISARSNRRFNVEQVMRRMNGGGHFSAAATTVESTDVEQVKEELIRTLQDMEAEYEGGRKSDNRRTTRTSGF